jgi:hypothetical protein
MRVWEEPSPTMTRPLLSVYLRRLTRLTWTANTARLGRKVENASLLMVAVRAEMDSSIEHVDYKQLVSSIAEAESFDYQTKPVREAVEALQLAIKEFSQPKLEASLQTAMRLHMNDNAMLEEVRKMLNDITNVRHRSVDAVKGVETAFATQGAAESRASCTECCGAG